jgi:hypothetical protein
VVAVTQLGVDGPAVMTEEDGSGGTVLLVTTVTGADVWAVPGMGDGWTQIVHRRAPDRWELVEASLGTRGHRSWVGFRDGVVYEARYDPYKASPWTGINEVSGDARFGTYSEWCQ